MFKGEEKLACQLTAFYELALDDDMIFRAIENTQFQWLQYVWVFGKNYLGPRNTVDAIQITYTQVFDIIKNMYEQSAMIKQGIKIVCEWMLITEDNILLALLYHYQDALALDFMGYYSKFIDKDLFLYSMNHGNRMFLQHALLMGAFDKTIFKEEEVVAQILVILKQVLCVFMLVYRDGCRTNFLLNVLLLIDISMWKNKHLKELLQVFEDYVEKSYEQNFLLLSYNPFMSIALTAELLRHIAKNRKRFENECKKICDDILALGKMYTSKIEDEKYYESLMMDTDFKGRTILKIVTENLFEPLMHEDDPKGENLMVKLWEGKEATKCDGNIYGYSNLSHIIWTKAKKTGGKASFFQLISNFFQASFTQDYTFQYRYRTRSISFYFRKEFFCAFVLLVLFQYINYEYLSLFRGQPQYLALQYDNSTGTNETIIRQDLSSSTYDFASVKWHYEELDGDQYVAKMRNGLRKYGEWQLELFILSVSLLGQLFLKQVFNVCSKKKIVIDKWTILDTINAVLNIVGFEIITNSSPEQLANDNYKNNLDYVMIFVLIVSWLRFFIYFLLVREISKMILTLYEMLSDTLSFIFIVVCYLVIVASVFTTLYQDVYPAKFGGLALSMRTLYDSTMAVYYYLNMGDREISFSVI